jgi:hypothetical protein
MPIIWGMMVQAAARAKPGERPGEFVLDENANKNIRQEAQRRYTMILRELASLK